MPYRLATPQDNLSVGVSKGFRTHDLQSHNLALYQLSYTHHKCGLLFQLANMVRILGTLRENSSFAQLVRVSREHYVKIHRDPHHMVRLEGFEPPTFALEGHCSIQLSYKRKYTIFVQVRTCIARLSLLVDQQGLEPWTP